MIDKEKLLEVKNNLEEQAVIYSGAVEDAWREKEEMRKRYDRIIENALFKKEKNEVLLTLVNNELRAMEEVEREKFVPWSEQEKAGKKAWKEKQQQKKSYDNVKAMMIEDGLTDHLSKDKEYTFEEFGEKVLDRYTEGMERVNASDKGESYTPKHYLLMDDLDKDYEYKQSAFKHPEIMERVKASARRAEEKESVEASTKDKSKDRSFASFLQKYWKISPLLASLLEKQQELEDTKQISNKDESKENLSNENRKNVTKGLENPSDESVTEENTKVWKKPTAYDSVTAKIKEGKELDPKEINSLFKPCYEIECAIVDILKKHKTLKLKDIVYFVEQKELDFESKHMYGFVQSVLNRSERFEKVSYGNWRLKKDEGETEETKPDSNDDADSIAESTVLSVVRPKWNGVISYVDKLGVVNKIEQK
jgi:hypothetical protein